MERPLMKPKIRALRNDAERAFQIQALNDGWEISKRGWPDFMIWKATGEVAVVEVKPNRHRGPKREQARVMKVLADAGIKTYLWSPDIGFRPFGERMVGRIS